TYLSDVFGVSGRALLESVMNGVVLEPADVKAKVKTQVRKKVPQLVDALNGRVRAHHRKMIRRHYDHLEVLEKEITALEAEIEDLLRPYQKEIELLDTIPGINKDAAANRTRHVGISVGRAPCFLGRE
ncbi:transposase and inactivated derivative, partial [Paenibacillus popilliae ATCC 14706]